MILVCQLKHFHFGAVLDFLVGLFQMSSGFCLPGGDSQSEATKHLHLDQFVSVSQPDDMSVLMVLLNDNWTLFRFDYVNDNKQLWQ